MTLSTVLLLLLSAVSMPVEGTDVRVTLKTGAVKDGLVLRRLEKGFLLKTATSTEMVPLDQASSITPVPTAAPAGPEMTIVTWDGQTHVGPATETATGYEVQTKRGKVSVPFEKIKSMTGGTAPTPTPAPAAAAPVSTVPPPVVQAPPPPPRTYGSTAVEDSPRTTRDTDDDEPRTEVRKQKFVRFGFGLNAAALPINDITWLVGVEATLQLVPSDRISIRFFLNYTHYEDRYTAGNVVLLAASPHVWFGPYGIGLLLAVGPGFFQSKRGGWDGPSFGALVAGSPLTFKFGQSVRNEVGVDVGFVAFYPHGVQPFYRLAYTLTF